MNKYGFLSALLTLILLFFQFIPLGLYFEGGGDTSIWLLQLFGITENPFLDFYVSFPVNIFHYQNYQIYLWGILEKGKLNLWNEVHFLSFIILSLFSLLAGIFSLIGSMKDKESGKKMMNFSFYCLLFVILYCVIGIPIYSKEILNNQLQFLDIFFYLSYGFYILLIDFILLIVAKYNHPIQS